MAIVILGTRKGGSGKTTTALSLAGTLANRGCSVCFVDTDTQRTGDGFIARRNLLNENGGYKGVQVPFIKSEVKDSDSTIAADLVDLAKRYDHVIVDTGGFENRAFTTGVQVADIVYIPMSASLFDLEQTMPTLNAIRSIETGRRDLGQEDFSIDVRLLPCRIAHHDKDVGSEFRNLARKMNVALSSCSIKEVKAIRDGQASGLTPADLKIPARGIFELLADEVTERRSVAVERATH